MPRWTKTIEERLWGRIDRRGPDECWEWRCRSVGPNGYGYIYFRGRQRGAHRVTYILTHGEIPEGLYVCHACDNRLCCNPSHLWLGTHQENQADMGRKGRTFSPAKKLSDDDVREIRRLCEEGELLQREIAERFGVQRTCVSRIKTGARRERVS